MKVRGNSVTELRHGERFEGTFGTNFLALMKQRLTRIYNELTIGSAARAIERQEVRG